ncbi:membrane protein insertion efficiency factor YidD [Frankia sp. AgB1.9]|uniref:membrane protein insertion efficiency factor YidD n=1 Tax=unclassified Frankia TaxID=2632575 RepID=UPI0019322B5B|nr:MULTISPECIES: membrane protein insertion efficiency factor YidD [unclassified Frankia]MBL7489749.1 membrane protein insertion efficiency factor YidD [Frankia sp. AgW1.1]MBL7547539.1 membrane protein insertion efficiency factor YidD [Frankia sp. AgB1.9]MBL7624381.1 membrane protein insertion efficiency factor YidD [Frankia sp. AgB1.8]
MIAFAWAGIVLGPLALLDLALASATLRQRAPRIARDQSGAVRGPLAWVFAALIRGYQLVWSPRSAGACRFDPSCSVYALSAVRIHGGVRGGLLAGWRLLRCQPLSRGGYDPVPVESARGAWRS